MPGVDTDLNYIAIFLAAFFIVAVVINTIVNRARRRKIENQRAARTGGGTEEAPIHLTTPFTGSQAPETLDAPPAATADAAPSPKDQDDEYVWE